MGVYSRQQDLQVKASLYMDDVAVFYSDLLSVARLMRICDQFKLASGVKVLRRVGLASLPRNAPSSWAVPYHLFFMEKFAKKNIFDHKSIRKWSACTVLETLWEKEKVYPVVWFPDCVLFGLFPRMNIKTNIDCTWRTVNLVKDTLWSAQNLLVFQSKELTPTECRRL
eukprot:g30544.t1